MTTATLKAEWNRIKHKRGIYFSANETQQAGALLCQMSREDAIAFADGLIQPETTGYWFNVRNILTNAR